MPWIRVWCVLKLYRMLWQMTTVAEKLIGLCGNYMHEYVQHLSASVIRVTSINPDTGLYSTNIPREAIAFTINPCMFPKKSDAIVMSYNWALCPPSVSMWALPHLSELFKRNHESCVRHKGIRIR